MRSIISIPGSLSFAKLVMTSSASIKSAGNARYASQDPVIVPYNLDSKRSWLGRKLFCSIRSEYSFGRLELERKEFVPRDSYFSFLLLLVEFFRLRPHYLPLGLRGCIIQRLDYIHETTEKVEKLVDHVVIMILNVLTWLVSSVRTNRRRFPSLSSFYLHF